MHACAYARSWSSGALPPAANRKIESLHQGHSQGPGLRAFNILILTFNYPQATRGLAGADWLLFFAAAIRFSHTCAVSHPTASIPSSNRNTLHSAPYVVEFVAGWPTKIPRAPTPSTLRVPVYTVLPGGSIDIPILPPPPPYRYPYRRWCTSGTATPANTDGKTTKI